MSAGDYLDEIHQDIAEFAERHLEEDERDDFIDSLMERKGYVRSSSWATPEPQAGGGRQPLVRPRQQPRGRQQRGGQAQGQGQGSRSYFGRPR